MGKAHVRQRDKGPRWTLTQRPNMETLAGLVKEPRFSQFLGLDLGGGKGKKTALAHLRATGTGVVVAELRPRASAAPLYDAALIDILRSAGAGTLLAIDAPLTLPPCLRCTLPVCPTQERCVDPAVVEMRRLAAPTTPQDRDFRRGKPPVTPYTQRATDVYLAHRRGVRPRETLGQGMGPLTARAAHLTRALSDRFVLNQNLIEVYPRATLDLLGLDDPYKKRIDTRLGILVRLADLKFGPGVWREECVSSDHMFDAVICAYTAYLRQRDDWEIPVESTRAAREDGWIWAPPSIPVEAEVVVGGGAGVQAGGGCLPE